MKLRISFAALMLAPLAAAAGQIGAADVTGPAAWTSVCGLMNANSPAPGSPYSGTVVECNADSTPTGTAAATAAYSDPAVQTDLAAQGSATLGTIRVWTQTSAPSNASFPAASAQAGWEDKLFHAAPTPADVGKTAMLDVMLWVQGTLHADGFNSGAFLELVTYVDTHDYANPNRDQLTFGGQGFTGQPYDESIAGWYAFSVPVPLGIEFDLGVLGRGRSGPSSWAPNIATINHGLVDFAHTIRWGGITSLTYENVALDAHFDSASGIDWTQAVPVPEPATWALMAAGLALFASRRRGCRQSDDGGADFAG